ncbi:MAG: hypothetical protein U9O95_06360 [Candidatus Marinimicrobia bacterium]|nr:hypothetical protein [Candidatus Neomarinimicrobiota bacterium]
MNKWIKILFILLLVSNTLFAKGTIELAPYPWLKVNYENEAKIFNTTCEKLDYDDPFYHAQGDTSSYVKVLEIFPDESSTDFYSILFSIGEGGNSRYEFYLEGEFVTPAFIIYADHLDFLGNGIVVARGSMNEMFMRSRKFKISENKIIELKQPFYAVDIQSEANRNFNIFMTKRMKKVIGNVKKGDEISVLIAEFKNKYVYYLIRSKLGLTGWIKINQGTWVDETPIKDLYYHGD